MSDVDPLLASTDNCVTASELVRQFGLWQERALQQPVFILRRGRPSLVLTSLDLMRRLCATQSRAEAPPVFDLLLDAMREVVFVTDTAGRLAVTNRACRIALPGSGAGVSLNALLPEAEARLLAEMGDRAHRMSTAEEIELPLGGRQLRIAIVPAGPSTLYVAADMGAAADAERGAAQLSALDEAIDLFDDLAWVRINLRGYIEASSPSLTRMTAIDSAILGAARFVTLIDLGARSAAAEAIEAVIADGVPRRLDARLHGAKGTVIPVSLAFSAERRAGRTRHVTVIVRTAPTFHDIPKS